ncbi:hypothetical protein [Streptomyces sp. BK79]|uniref:hypothetical protein n=1 Tax=Streptomyces sp. BK79 TaxID=3350097 RepID=UPI0037704D9E
MEEQTYDPILGCEDLPKWRLINPLRPPAPGRALVLVRDSGPSLTIRSGEEIPSSRFGTYSTVFTVDMTEHRLVLDIPLLSRDPTFSFRSRVDLVCRVAGPAEVVARGIRDMSGALYGYLRKALRTVARDYDIAEFHEAEMALNASLAGFGGDDAVRLRNIQIELLVDEDEIATAGREYRDVVRETRLDGMRRRRHLDMIREEGVDGLIAEIMEKEGARAALAWIEKGEAEKREVRREVMRMVLERGDAGREPFEQAELERAVLDEVLRDGDGLFETATRRGRLRGSLARALEPGPGESAGEDPAGRDREHGPLRGEVVRDRYDSDHDRGGYRPEDPYDRGGSRPEGRGTGTARTRLTGTAGRPPGSAARGAAPPEDEPLPDAFGGPSDDRSRDRSWDPRDRPWDRSRDRRGDGGAEDRTGAGRTDGVHGDGGPGDGGPGYGGRADGGRPDPGRPDPGGVDRGRADPGRGDAPAPRRSRVRGTAKRPRPGGSGTGTDSGTHKGEPR